jgi:hypothetical protein
MANNQKSKSNPKSRRIATSKSNHRYEKQALRTAANKARRARREKERRLARAGEAPL